MPVQTFIPLVVMGGLFGAGILGRKYLATGLDALFDTHLLSDTEQRQVLMVRHRTTLSQ